MLGLDSAIGTAYFDGVQLEKGTVANPYNLIENSSFERGTDYWSLTATTDVDGIVSDGNDAMVLKYRMTVIEAKKFIKPFP